MCKDQSSIFLPTPAEKRGAVYSEQGSWGDYKGKEIWRAIHLLKLGIFILKINSNTKVKNKRY